MAIDQTRPLLKLNSPSPSKRRRSTGGGGGGRTFAVNEQISRLGPRFNSLREALSRPQGALELRDDPTALAPERLIVLETSGGISNFQNAVSKVMGLEYIGDHDLDADDDKRPEHYLLMPSERALKELLSLWDRWKAGQAMERGFTPWRDVFIQLRDVRPWGPQDRVTQAARTTLEEQISGRDIDDTLKVEIELVFRSNETTASVGRKKVVQMIEASEGRVVSAYRRSEFDYDAILAELTVGSVLQIIARDSGYLAGADPIASIIPQSTFAATPNLGTGASPVTDNLVFNPVFPARRDPVVGIFDAVPIQAHPYLTGGLVIDDPHDLEARAVGERVHGTAMASAALHGDLRQPLPTPDRPIYFRPVMYAPASMMPGHNANERFVDDRLIVDVMCEAVERMVTDTAPTVLVVNISLGDIYRPYHRRVSMWARALDYLSFRHGIIFVVSAGNDPASLHLEGITTPDGFNALTPEAQIAKLFGTVNSCKADRKIIAPAESINALTVGAWHKEVNVSPHPNAAAKVPYPSHEMPNLTSRLGLGILGAIKPDIMVAGGREHFRLGMVHPPVTVDPMLRGTRFAGICVAGQVSSQRQHDFTLGSSVAAATATGTAARLHDSLESEYGAAFTALPKAQKASLLKALLAHPADWKGANDLILPLVDPDGTLDWEKQRAETARHVGYGFVDPLAAMSCTQSRATLWATGSLPVETAITYAIKIPSEIGRLPGVREIRTTLSWISPIRPRHSQYRSSKLRIAALNDSETRKTGVKTHNNEPGYHNIERGTLSHRRWVGERIGDFAPNGTLNILVQRDKDAGSTIDDAIPYALVVSLILEDGTAIYEDVLTSLAVKPRTRQRILPR